MSRYRALIGSLLTEVPRTVPTTGWPVDNYTIIMTCVVSSAIPNNTWILDTGVSINNRGVGIKLDAGTDYLRYKTVDGGPSFYDVTNELPRNTSLNIEIKVSAAGIYLVVNGVSNNTPGAFLTSWPANCGVMADYTGAFYPAMSQATKFKVLSGIYADFATADAVTGANLIFNGLVP